MGRKVERKCPVCGLRYSADEVRLKHGRETTCSRDCSYKLRATSRNKSKTYNCAVCGKEVLRSPAQVKSRFVFCSRDCHYRGRSMGFVQRIVKQPYNVSEQGRKGWNEAGNRRKGIPRKGLITWVCEICKKECSITRGQFAPARKLRFCSPECANKAMRGASNPSWRGGHPEYYGPNWRPLQRQARKEDDYKCQRCGVSQEELGRALDVHHIRPVSTFAQVNDANYLENVVSICHDCHMLVEWNGIDFKLPDRCNGAHHSTRRIGENAQQSAPADADKPRR
jgi:5-methylcytosine-specific restriction endonuclease McrA